jgi:uncharacterized NAD-dependent epimerase/dehydratase family protein
MTSVSAWSRPDVDGVHQLRKPYLLMIGDVDNPINAKTAFGLKDWVPEACLGQLRLGRHAVDVGLPDLSPQQAVARGAKTLIIGIAPPGGRLPPEWHGMLLEALESGLDLAAGLHQRLKAIPELTRCAERLGRQIHDVRHCDTVFSVGSGIARSGRRLLTVGTDCVVGKKYTALAIAKEMAARGRSVDFRATGQTGILISGRGVAIDAVVGDFLSGAAEALHPAYAAVTLGLVHGSQPDALVLCHDVARKTLASFPHVPVVPLEEAIPGYLSAAHLTNPKAQVLGVALNTSSLSADEATAALQQTASRLSLPCVDPIRTGVAALVSALERFETV